MPETDAKNLGIIGNHTSTDTHTTALVPSTATQNATLQETKKGSKTSLDSRSSFFKRNSHLSEDARRDSGMAQSVSTTGNESNIPMIAREGRATTEHTTVPSIVVQHAPSTMKHTVLARRESQPRENSRFREELDSQPSTEAFEGITTDIPTSNFGDPFLSEELSFSNRGSVLWSGKKADDITEALALRGEIADEIDPPINPNRLSRPLSPEEVNLSQKVRLLYERGDDQEDISRPASALIKQRSVVEAESELDTVSELPRISLPQSGYLDPTLRTGTSSRRSSYLKMEPYEAAGGIENWQDVDVNQVDRYGFIKSRSGGSRGSSVAASPMPGTPQPSSRPGTGTGQDNLSPRKKLQKNRLSSANRSTTSRKPSPSRPAAAKTPSVFSGRSRRSNASTLNPFASSSSNKGRRWADEANTMLTSLPGLPHLPNSDIPISSTTAKASLERKREAKWAKMAIKSSSTPLSIPKTTQVGGGAHFTFDLNSEKLHSRVWKGIPDRWRGPAWQYFLLASAKRHKGYVPEEDLKRQYQQYQGIDCADDPQIDMDVPRTIGGHVMFRKRYRGGQKLLWRVLRALALHFPETGYVQGMAPLVATLLCYYQEEEAFVMGVRLWQCRGMEELYRPGFAGLMGALTQFEKDWLARLPVAKQLEQLGIPPTTYGTKWYLTLFSYSIPFAAQLRVWDVFMLLGSQGTTGPSSTITHSIKDQDEVHIPEANLDVVHAVSAALIDAMQDILLGADFENAMKVLTSQVPVGHEDVMMRIARKEWKERKKAASK